MLSQLCSGYFLCNRVDLLILPLSLPLLSVSLTDLHVIIAHVLHSIILRHVKIVLIGIFHGIHYSLNNKLLGYAKTTLCSVMHRDFVSIEHAPDS